MLGYVKYFLFTAKYKQGLKDLGNKWLVGEDREAEREGEGEMLQMKYVMTLVLDLTVCVLTFLETFRIILT
jgi:hypothetical protein